MLAPQPFLVLAALLTSAGLALASPQNVVQVDLERAGEADGWHAAAFDPQGDLAYLAHLGPGVITRYELPGPTPNGRITGSVEYGTSGGPLSISPDGASLYAVDSFAGEFCSIDAATMTVTDRISTPGISPGWVIVEDSGARAVIVSQFAAPQLTVVDLSLMTVTQSITVAGGLQGFPGSLQQPVFFAEDGITLVCVAGSFGAQSLVAYDSSTGVQTASVALGVAGATALSLSPSGDSSKVIVGYQFIVGSAAQTGWSRFDAATLAPLGDLSFGAAVTSVSGLVLDEVGMRGTATLDGVVTNFPVTGPTYDPQDPSILRFGGSSALGFLWMSSGDRLARFGGGGATALTMDVYDAGATFLGDAPSLPIGIGPMYLGAGNDLLFGGFGFEDRVRAMDLSAASGPYVASVDINTGFGEEFDSPYSFVRQPGTSTLAVAAMASGGIKVVDARRGVVSAVLDTARGPSTMAFRRDGQLVVGHNDGTLLVIDPATGAETLRLRLGQPIEEVVVEPAGTRVYARLRAEFLGAGPSLDLVETGGALPGILASVPISGSGFFTPEAGREIGNGSMWFDWDQDVAFVVSAQAGTVDAVSLSGLVVTDTAFAPSIGGDPSVIATSNAARVFVTDGGGLVSAFSTAGGLTREWTVGCGPGYAVPRRLALTGDEQTLLVDSRDSMPWQTCPGMGAYSAASGAFLDSVAFTSGLGGMSLGTTF